MKTIFMMFKTLVAWGAGESTPSVRWMTHDTNESAIKFHMKAGIPGDVNRSHPVSIEANLIDSADVTPPTAYGQLVILAAGGKGVRPYAAADQSDANASVCWGATVRPNPAQQQSGGMTSNFGAATPPTSGVIDIMRAGYMSVVLNDVTALPNKGDAVYVWCAATAGIHVQGGLEVGASAGNTTKISNAVFGGPPDVDGNTEIIIQNF